MLSAVQRVEAAAPLALKLGGGQMESEAGGSAAAACDRLPAVIEGAGGPAGGGPSAGHPCRQLSMNDRLQWRGYGGWSGHDM